VAAYVIVCLSPHDECVVLGGDLGKNGHIKKNGRNLRKGIFFYFFFFFFVMKNSK